MADDSAQSTPTSNTAASSETSEAEAELDREIIRLFFANVGDSSPRRYRDHPNPPRNVEGLHTCAMCGIHGYIGAQATPTCPRFLVCEDCPTFHRVKKCLNCFLLFHRSSPVHFATEWTGTCWERTPLRRLGFVFQLGHRGLACPSAEAEEKRMTVIAANGIHIVKFRYCNCPGHPEGVAQLVNVGWFPGRDEVKCVTFEMLGICTALGVIP
ncbi:hypothetical protein C8R47DRAFT_1221018 [Mycena vitilis]|nr:hypothetical protein C8R47DRAFT_1221018 [Mycena vitilis]